MARRRFLIAYDISDPKRLRRVCKTMEEYGDRLQYSVFICDLSRTELIHTRAAVERHMNLAEDSVLIIDLAEPHTTKITFIGKHRDLPTHEPRII
jgi:CRISPR-associated protein Cas2